MREPIAANIGDAAGLQGRHKWGLIWPSSARDSLVTYQTVIAVRYPGLVHIENGVVSYGTFFSTDVNQAGGFLPIVWDAPGSNMEVAEAVSLVIDCFRIIFRFGAQPIPLRFLVVRY